MSGRFVREDSDSDEPVDHKERQELEREMIERRVVAHPPVRLGDSLGRLVRHLGWAEEVRSVGLLARWGEIVGPAIAAHTRPLALEGTTLVVAVDDPAWASQLRWLEEDLLVQLAEAGGGQVERLVLRVRGRR